MVAKIVVVGSCMVDLNCYSARLPKCGETIVGTKFSVGHGGKGANQCVAAARLGAEASLVARLGDDRFGMDYLEDLRKNGIDTEFVALTPGQHSGVAQISVADSGDNTIIIVPGANHSLSPEDVRAARQKIVDADVVLFQFETPVQTTVEALKIIRSAGKGISIVNGAPALADPHPDVYKLADIFCVNESEAEVMTGISVSSPEDAGKAVRALLDKGCGTAVVTLGAKGAVFATNQDPKSVHIPARTVKAVDTTGAGDAFLGALAFFIAEKPDTDFSEKVRRAAEYATLSVERPGTQDSFPLRSALPPALIL